MMRGHFAVGHGIASALVGVLNIGPMRPPGRGSGCGIQVKAQQFLPRTQKSYSVTRTT